MTKRDYKIIAKIISEIEGLVSRKYIAEKFSQELVKDNPRFDFFEFEEACSGKVAV